MHLGLPHHFPPREYQSRPCLTHPAFRSDHELVFATSCLPPTTKLFITAAASGRTTFTPDQFHRLQHGILSDFEAVARECFYMQPSKKYEEDRSDMQHLLRQTLPTLLPEQRALLRKAILRKRRLTRRE